MVKAIRFLFMLERNVKNHASLLTRPLVYSFTR